MCYVLLLLPPALVVLSATAISLVAWRFLYLPSAVLIGAIAYLLEKGVKPKALAIGVFVVLSAFYAAEIYPKNSLFGKDETGFWLGIKNPGREDALVRYNIAVKTLPLDEGKALLIFDDILGKPDHPLYRTVKTWIFEDLGVYYAFRKEFPKAESYFRKLFASERQPSLRLTFNYSYYLAFAGKRDDGERIVSETLGRFPGSHFVLTQAAKFYVIVQDFGRAAELYAEDYRLFRNRQSLLLAQQAAELQQKNR
jgi:tetratricopeptide (TPR) repeat protein